MTADWRDWELDEIPEWSPVAQNILLGVLAVTLFAASIFFVVLPAQEEVNAAKQEESLLRTQFRIKAEQVAALPDVEEQVQELQRYYARLTQQLPAQDELALLLAGINDTGLQYNLNFARLNWRSGKRVGWLHQVPLEIELNGSYRDIGQFSAALARLPRIVALQDFTVSRVDKRSDLRFVVTAHTYRYENREFGGEQ
ncbi:pilus assembly protein PilO [Enterovibrio norvegicus FF-33]|uniref:type 4a pilus biogenesis protein PilO n=1 Tax=Enterovibrio norvegicus TaxID=188144 RepID=UPI0002FB424A|nr:type 4a pilus biogenesis protein PilO [Enterovibrio norvegicus]OEE68840.1 pilus assembly protein PilO [Enterovibrio norvegicus FF-33]OEE90380.1 pilus assembly protein PilO [Enterovibrio norvegicus FF-162]